MMGLLIKDFKLMKSQKSFFMIIIAIAVGMAVALEDLTFIIGYISFVGALFTLSTVSYDEFDNGNAFLFSLPITRKSYVLEKYEFGLIVSVGAWLFEIAVVAVVSLIKSSFIGSDVILATLLILSIVMIALAVMLPFQFKFGGEKGRIAIIGAIGLIFIVVFAATKIAELFNVDLLLMLNNLPQMSMGGFLAAALGTAVIILFISLRISVSIMNKKEF